MFQNYLVTALRNMKRNWLYAVISVFGLAVSFAGAILVFQFVRNEFSYDRWLPGYERIHKVNAVLTQPGQAPSPTDITQGYIAKELREKFPSIEAVARTMQGFPTINFNPANGDGIVDQTFSFADSEIFDVFPLPVVSGDLKGFQQPDTVVITRAVAKKYFGKENVVGETLDMQTEAEHHPMKVVAVLENYPSNTTLVTEVFASGKSSWAPFSRMDARPPVYTGISNHTFVRLKPGVTTAELQTALDTVGKPAYDAFATLGGTSFKLGYTPLAEAHITAPGLTDIVIKPTGSAGTATAVATVGLLIVLVAAINFVTLMTARASRRALEVGVRKAVGAHRSDLIAQFMGEALIYAFLSMFLAVILAMLLLQPFSDFVRRGITLDFLGDPMLGLGLLGMTLVIGLLGGLYPALVLSSFRPATVLKGGAARNAGSPIARQALVVVQFAILIGLIVSTITIYRQTDFALKQGLGKESDLMVQVWTPCNNAFPDEVRKLPGVARAGCASLNALNAPFAKNIAPLKTPDGQQVEIDVAPVDFDFFETFNIAPVAGRLFSRDRGGDDPPPLTAAPLTPVTPAPGAQVPPRFGARPIILNETAVKKFGFDSPAAAVGKQLIWNQPMAGPEPLPSEIVGVVPDMPANISAATAPAFYFVFPRASGMLSIRTTGKDVAGTVRDIQRVWKDTKNVRPIQLVFLSQTRQTQYLDIIIQGVLIGVCAAAAVTIACLGLFALSAFAAERRIKEIGIRKALGATTSNVVGLLMWQFTIPVLWAIVIALPVGYLLMSRWLEGYAYRVDLPVWTLVIAAFAALAIAWLTVLFQTFAAASAKPVRALRHE